MNGAYRPLKPPEDRETQPLGVTSRPQQSSWRLLAVLCESGSVLVAGAPFVMFSPKRKVPDQQTFSDRGPSGSLTLVEQGHVLAQGPQAVECAEPLKYSLQSWRHTGAVYMCVESLQHSELHEGQGQGPAEVHLQTEQRPGGDWR